MSEFKCAQGHIIGPESLRCKICNGRVHTMDGITNEEFRAMMGLEEDEEIAADF